MCLCVLSQFCLLRYTLAAMKRTLLFLLLVSPLFAQSQTTLAATPPMGWNSWNKFACNVSENLIKQAADAIVSSGMKDAGYEYVVIDDCWQVSRDKDGNIIADPQHFPSGIKAVADYVHSRGLKFGIYSDAGLTTCQHRPGGRGYEYQDARQYAAWGVDYLKYDWCDHSTQDAPSSYSLMHDALVKSGRPIVFSICEWGSNKPWLWAEKAGGNLWRSTGDIQDHWEGQKKWDDGSCCSNGVLDILDQENGLESYAGPGHWNDPDMLEVGNGGMTDTEYRSHFSLWAMMAAPLLIGSDLRKATPATLRILGNREVIALDQDRLGAQATVVSSDGGHGVLRKPLAGGDVAVALFNESDVPGAIGTTAAAMGLPRQPAYRIRDLWRHDTA